MKLLYCGYCHDVVALRLDDWRSCICGKTGGRYIDNLNAEIIGTRAFALAILNASFVNALKNREDKDRDGVACGVLFESYVIPKEVETIKQDFSHDFLKPED